MTFAMQGDQYEMILQNLSPQQSQVLRALGQAGGQSNLSKKFIESTGISLLPSIAKALDGLIKKRIVQKTGTTYHLCDPFLGAWLARAVPGSVG